MGRCWGKAASHLPQRTQWLAFQHREAGFPLVPEWPQAGQAGSQLVPDAEVVGMSTHRAGHTVMLEAAGANAS